jgi:hypothetical protein
MRPAASSGRPVRLASYFFEQARPSDEEACTAQLCTMEFPARKFLSGGITPWLPHRPTSKGKRSPGKTA